MFKDKLRLWSIVDQVALFSILVIGCLLIPKTGVLEAGDNTAQYIDEALRILARRPLALEIMRGPGFPGILALFFAVFGTSVKVAFIAVRVCHVLCMLFAYLLARKLFGSPVGLLTAVLLLTSYVLAAVSVWMTPDIPLALFLLVLVWSLSGDLSERRFFWIVIAGVAYGMACLTKEHALQLFPFPFLALYRKGISKKEYIRSIFLFLGVWFVLYGPWAYYVTVVRRIHWFGLFGFVSPQFASHSVDKMVGDRSDTGTLAFLMRVLFVQGGPGLLEFYKYALKPHFSAASLFSLSWVYCAIRSWRSDRFRTLVIPAVCFLPIIIATGLHHAGIRQVAVFLYLSQVAFAIAAVEVGAYGLRFILTRYPVISPDDGRRFGYIVLVFTIASIQLFDPSKSTVRLLRKGGRVDSMKVYPACFGFPADFEAAGPHRKDVETMAHWMLDNLVPGEDALLLSRHPQGFHLFLGFDFFKERPLPHRCKRIEGCRGFPTGLEIRPVLIAPYSKFRRSFERYRNITFFTAQEIEEQLSNSRYVVVDHPSLEEKLLDRLPLAKRRVVCGSLALFELSAVKVDDLRREVHAALSKDPVVHDDMRDDLLWLGQYYPDELKVFLDGYLQRGVSLEKLVHLYEPYNQAVRLLGRPIAEIQRIGYEKLFEDWVVSHIPMGSRVAYSYAMGPFPVPDRYKLFSFSEDLELGSLRGNDYLFIHNSRRQSGQFPTLFSNLTNHAPLALFPSASTLGEGWEIYKLAPSKGERPGQPF